LPKPAVEIGQMSWVNRHSLDDELVNGTRGRHRLRRFLMDQTSPRPRLRHLPHALTLLAGTVAGLALALAPAASAQAAVIGTTACNSSTPTQPFAQWGDSHAYDLVPGGDFAPGAPGWKLSGGATTIAGGQPYNVPGASHSSALYLPAGASATSPLTCVNAAYPTLRLFTRNNSLTSALVVQVLYDEPVLGLVALPVGATALSTSWKPTSPMPTLSAVAGALTGGTAQVALRFTAIGGASEIDDVFIDPRSW
jgi:hypothetical protein